MVILYPIKAEKGVAGFFQKTSAGVSAVSHVEITLFAWVI